jgi:8-oxo-dGTP pyrophosphatase MutT (NUDIX family)
MNTVEISPGRTITTLASRQVYRNHWMRVREDLILRSNGEKGVYGVVEKEDSAIIIPIHRGRIWLVEQFRYTIEERALELPQGGWEMEIEDPEVLARGELKEETGLEASEMIFLGSMWVSYGFAKQRQHVFVATGLVQAEPEPDAEEHDLTVHPIFIEEFEEMIRDGTIRDNSTLAAWALYLTMRGANYAALPPYSLSDYSNI